MYAVVGCGSCRALWIRRGEAETAQCPRCGTRHRVDNLRALGRADTAAGARELRSTLLAERSPHGTEQVAGYRELSSEIDEAGPTDRDYLQAHDIDAALADDAGDGTPSSPSRSDIVLETISTVADPTQESIVAHAAEQDLSPAVTKELLDRLLEVGHVIQDGDRYRVV